LGNVPPDSAPALTLQYFSTSEKSRDVAGAMSDGNNLRHRADSLIMPTVSD
jgi:hypothetical protein